MAGQELLGFTVQCGQFFDVIQNYTDDLLASTRLTTHASFPNGPIGFPP